MEMASFSFPLFGKEKIQWTALPIAIGIVVMPKLVVLLDNSYVFISNVIVK
jgi:hypothetical protein